MRSSSSTSFFSLARLPRARPSETQNADGRLDLTDSVFLLGHLFLGGAAPPALSGFEARTCVLAPEAIVLRGMEVFATWDQNGSQFACATCHSAIPEEVGGLRRPGHSLYDALRRPTYKNGELGLFLEAANTCRTEWMFAREWSGDDEDYLDVVSFLHESSPSEAAPALTYLIVPSTIEGPSQGDPAAGCATFHWTCVVCHGDGASGTSLAPSLVFNPNAGLDTDFVRRQVRTSGNPNSVYGDVLTGGVMPFWWAERLSDGNSRILWRTSRHVRCWSVASRLPRPGRSLDEGPSSHAFMGSRM